MATPAEQGLDGTDDIYDIVIECKTLFNLLAERTQL